MIRFALAPRWWAWHLALVAVLVSFGWLGWWQLNSFGAAADGPRGSARSAIVGIDEVTERGGRLGADDVGRRVRATGTWEPAGQLVVPGREVDGRTGALVLTPLRTDEGVLPVVRGWVPGETEAPAPPPGVVTVTGVLQQSETESAATVAPGGLPEGQVSYVATVTVLERLPYDADRLYDGFVVLRAQDPVDPAGAGGLTQVVAADQGPPGGGVGQVGRWRNLAYGLQWWLFALAAAVFWGSVLRRSRTEHLSGPGRADPDGEPAPRSLAAPRRTT